MKELKNSLLITGPWQYSSCYRELSVNTRLIGNMITNHDIVRLRARATYFGREAARAKSRNCLIYCRALAAHLDREACELERDIGSNAPREPEKRSAVRT